MFKKILVPLDGSNQAESILPQVKTIAGRCGALVILLKVESPAILLGRDEVIDVPRYRENRSRCKLESEHYLLSIAEKLQAENIVAQTVVESGNVVNTILAVASREDADLLAMASIKCSDRMKNLYTSITTGVLMRTDRPIIVRGSNANTA